ncbi:glycosyltransferase [Tumebacillus sp. DT12]|uniref:Glycosyltransferase n=1 Tax=Tumebacillus lacus TaxID=2995335 RepID=A0ABT3WYF0_9BACL|nr:glycosyltransferase [Tumebacillus lacus]MCX7568782.1 glycosyltransferase [Tumebacillus lacus]
MLMISYYAPPMLNAESILVAKTLKFLSQTFDVELLTVSRDSDFKEDPYLIEEMGEGTKVRRFRNPKPQSRVLRKIYREVMNRFSMVDNPLWLGKALQAVERLPDAYDVIYSRSQPGASHIAALSAKKKLGIPWIAQFSDPWGHNPYHPYHGRRKAVIERYESEVIELADHLIFPTVEMRDLYASVYPKLKVKQRSTVLPHHFDQALYGEGQPEKQDESKISLAYIGDFYGLRSPEPLLKALTELRERRPDLVERLQLDVIGNVERTFHGQLEDAEKRLGMRVNRVGQVPYRTSLVRMAQADLLLLVDAPSDVNLFLSSKLIDYFGARRPILGITSTKGTAGRLIAECGWNVHHPDDVAGISLALERYLGELTEYQERARHLELVDRYRSETVVGELAGLFEKLGNKKRN